MRYVVKTVAVVLIGAAAFVQQGTAVVWAQSQPPVASNGPPVTVAVIDIPQIFKNHPRFKQQMEAIKAEVENFEKETMEDRKLLMKQKERLDSYTVGSPEYKKLEEELARQFSDVQVKGGLRKKDVVEREAKVYYETYNDIVREVAKVADSYGISLVLRHDGDTIDVRDRNSILQGVNRPIVYHRNLDLTQIVLKQINERLATRPTGPGAAGGVPPAGGGSTLRPR